VESRAIQRNARREQEESKKRARREQEESKKRARERRGS